MKKNNLDDNQDFGRGNFKIPAKILKQLNEMSGGGFVLFILNDKGEPSIYEGYDSPSYESLIKSFALDWLEAERMVRKEDLKNEIRLNSVDWETIEEETQDDDNYGDLNNEEGDLDEED